MTIRRYAPTDADNLFALIEREGDEWTYWQGENRAKYEKALHNSIVYLCFEEEILCGYARCFNDFGFGIYVLDLLVDKDYRGKSYGRHLMEQALKDFPEETVYVNGDVYLYYEKLGYHEEGKIYIVNEKSTIKTQEEENE